MSMLHFVQQQLKGSSCYAHALAACLSSLPCQQVAPPSAGKLGRTSEEVNCTAAGGASNTSCHCLPRTQASHSWSARSQSCSFSTCCRASVPDSCREPCQGTSPMFRTSMPAHIISFPSIHQARDLSTSQACQTSQAAEAAASRQEPESGPARIYWDKRHAGVYRADPRQELTINMLQDLFERLVQGVGQPRRLRGKRSGLTIVDAVASKDDGSFSGGGFWSGINSLMKGSRDSPSDRPHIQGLYMYGGVGCGKTMLMDLFVEAAPPELQVKRTHFHDFMLEVHTKLRDFKCDRDPLLRVADSIAKNVRVLAMDEFFVTDVADAMILHRLF
ncbi:AFG1-like ATPase-domain-containing protein, partial [Dunaliella salina]